MREPQPPFVSVKFDAVGRSHRFLLPESDFELPWCTTRDLGQ